MQSTVFANGVFHTMDETLGTVRALAVRGERIVAAGSNEDCILAAGPGAQIVDLAGAPVVPGLTDSHIHTAEYARSLVAVNLRGTATLEQTLERVAMHAAARPGPAWVTGSGWDANRWPIPVPPHRRDLDRILAERPVALRSADVHTMWLNSAALARVGIDRATPDPAGGAITRDVDGEPTGILRERAVDLVERALPRDADALPDLLRAALQRLLSHGVTGIHDIDGPDALSAFEALRATDELPIRVHKLIRQPWLDAAIESGQATGDGDCWLRVGAVKLFADGALGSHSCLMTEGFADEPNNHGIAVTPYPELLDLVRRATRSGIAVAAHAIGDLANHRLLDAFADVAASMPRARLRHRIEHAQFLRRADIARIADLGVVASMQPTHCTSDIPLVEKLLAGQDLACYAWRSLLDSGAVVAFGSDAPVEDPNPWPGIHAAVTRQRADGTPEGGWRPAERVTVAQALHAYTAAPAYASGEEHLKGMLRPGMLADFAVLSDDPLAVAPAALHRVSVLSTVVGGRVRWSA